MMICPACRREVYEGELICLACGASLPSPAAEESKRTSVPISQLFQNIPTSPLVHNIPRDLQPGQVALLIAGEARPMILQGYREYLLGRSEQAPLKPDVDFDPYGGRPLGVSRMHASLRVTAYQVLLMDIGSANGTWLNGTPLSAHEPVRLENGDEIRLGKLVMRIYFAL